jgi:hypothetical protein
MHHHDHDAGAGREGGAQQPGPPRPVRRLEAQPVELLICCRTATHSMRNYSPVGAVCITLVHKKSAARNSAARPTVYPRFSTFEARAFAARRMRRMFAEWFVNLLMSPLKI